MSADLYKILYCSRSHIEGPPRERDAEIERILRAARERNLRRGITGALLSSCGCFAQALEGPETEVKETFRKIQKDPRHDQFKVLMSARAEIRDFPNWAMARVQCESEGRFAGAAATLEMALARRTGPQAEDREVVRLAVLKLLQTLVLEQTVGATSSVEAAMLPAALV